MDLRDIQECGLIGYDGSWLLREKGTLDDECQDLHWNV